MDEHSFQYTGIDINESLIAEGRKRYQNANFWLGDICRDTINKTFDFVFSSGVFNHQLTAMDEYDFIKVFLFIFKIKYFLVFDFSLA
jgi:trans-aconitate methyltransferase